MQNALVFQSTTFDIVDRNSQPWLRGAQVALSLGYKNPDNAIKDLYTRNAAEFTDSMTALVKLPTAGGEQETRIFSMRGAHLLGMFARTDKATEFRRWVLDILDRETTAAHPTQMIERGPVPQEKRPSEWVQRVNRRAYSLSQGMYTPYRTQILAANPDIPEEWIPDAPAASPGVKVLPSARYHYPRSLLNQQYFVSPKSGTATLDLGMLCAPEFVSPLLALMNQMRSEGHDITAAFDEAQALRTALDNAGIALASINALVMRATNGSAE